MTIDPVTIDLIDVIDYEHGISALDSGFFRKRLDAIHFIIEDGHAAIVDTGINASVPLVLEALSTKGLRPEDVDFIFLTHIHLDHAGGASQLMRLMPHAKLVVHLRGARHMADPSKLWAATVAVYGKEVAERNYGEIIPIAKERIIEAPHEFALDFRGRRFTFYDTPGHAKHQVAIRDARSGHLFVGDTCGLAYTEVETNGKRYSFPTSSPSQFEPDALHRSLDLIASLNPEALYLTHYAQIRDVPRILGDLHRLIDAHTDMARTVGATGVKGAERQARLMEGMAGIILGERDRHGWKLTDGETLDVFIIDHELNAQGLGIWLDTL